MSLRHKASGSAPQDPEHIVLCHREPKRLEDQFQEVVQHRRSAHDVQHRLLLEAPERRFLFDFLFKAKVHGLNIGV
jgi:hypothetical protein